MLFSSILFSILSSSYSFYNYYVPDMGYYQHPFDDSMALDKRAWNSGFFSGLGKRSWSNMMLPSPVAGSYYEPDDDDDAIDDYDDDYVHKDPVIAVIRPDLERKDTDQEVKI